ncbi:MAG TPA: DUF4340 domain-containing protein [Casimicrobiaceae bacterium]|nr:DUF4340 domain-containing protein [Casimicrobiaceae bacterium]
MNAKTLYLLVAVAIIAVVGAVALRMSHSPRVESDEQAKPLLPGLAGHVNDVSAITVTGAGGKAIATMKRAGDGWHIVERSDYPADVTEIRGLLVKLDRATLLEAKTSNPKHYADIAVDDVTGKDAKGVLVTLTGVAPPNKVIVGNYSGPSQGTFVRRDGEAQSWLASGDLNVPKSLPEWEKRDIADIPAAKIASVTLVAPDGKTLRMHKPAADAANFVVDDVPKGRTVNNGTASTIATTFSGLRVDDVESAKDKPAPAQAAKGEFETFDGVKIAAVAWNEGGKDYVQFAASLDAPAAEKQIADDQAKAKADYDKVVASHKSSTNDKPSSGDAKAAEPAKPRAVSDPESDKKARLADLDKDIASLNASFSGWTFVLPGYVYGNLTKTMNDVLMPLPAKKPEVDAAKSASSSTGSSKLPIKAKEAPST